jgi:hypothetical protein
MEQGGNEKNREQKTVDEDEKKYQTNQADPVTDLGALLSEG